MQTAEKIEGGLGLPLQISRFGPMRSSPNLPTSDTGPMSSSTWAQVELSKLCEVAVVCSRVGHFLSHGRHHHDIIWLGPNTGAHQADGMVEFWK